MALAVLDAIAASIKKNPNELMHMSLGFVYILENPSMPGVLKIGQSAKDPKQRASELRTTGVPDPFEVVYFGLFQDFQHLERLVHAHLASYRRSNDREFFALPVEEAVSAIRNCATGAPIYEELHKVDEKQLREEQRIAARERKKEERLLKAQEELNAATEIFFSSKGLRLGSRRGPTVERFEGIVHPQNNIGVFRRKAVEIGTMGLLTSLNGFLCDQGGTWDNALIRASLAGKVRPFTILQLVFHSTTQIYAGEKSWPAGMPFMVSLRGADKTAWDEFLNSARDRTKSSGPIEMVLSIDRAAKKPKIVFSLPNCL